MVDIIKYLPPPLPFFKSFSDPSINSFSYFGDIGIEFIPHDDVGMVGISGYFFKLPHSILIYPATHWVGHLANGLKTG